MKEISAGGVVYRRVNGRIDIQMIRDRYGKMTMAKGKMEAGETIEETALREILEETGIRGRIAAPLETIRYAYDHPQAGSVDKEVHYYLVEALDGDLQAQVEEIDGVAWFAADEAWAHQKSSGYENNDAVFQRALTALLPGWIDHTALKPDVSEADVANLCREAIEHGFYSVCVNGAWVQACREALAGSEVRISAVCGFPLGACATEVKAFEAELAVKSGAAEIDMVMAVGQMLAGNAAYVEADIRAVVEAVRRADPRVGVKVILETGYLSDEQIAAACRLAERAGARYVKTSTGFGPGGATEAHIRLMRESVSRAVGVKASGGVRDADAAFRMIAAGADRIGTSSGVAIARGDGGSASY